MIKCRVKSLRAQTKLKLDLRAVVYGTRLRSHIEEELQIKPNNVINWTDSTALINWINKEELSHNIL